MKKEICYIMVGTRRMPFTGGWLKKRTIGVSISVEFDGDWVLKREEEKEDVIGFWHSHPHGNTKPSKRDIKTIEAWIDCFGKPLFCVIQNSIYKTAYLVNKTQKGEFLWARQPLVYKFFNRFGVFL